MYVGRESKQGSLQSASSWFRFLCPPPVPCPSDRRRVSTTRGGYSRLKDIKTPVKALIDIHATCFRDFSVFECSFSHISYTTPRRRVAEAAQGRPGTCFLSFSLMSSPVFTQQLSHYGVCLIRDGQSTVTDYSSHPHQQ